MSGYDTIAVVDWSAANDTGPTPCKDAIWAGVVRDGVGAPPVYLRNRALALSWLTDLAKGEIAAGRRLFLGFDFPFGYPGGFGRRVCDSDDPLVLWDWFAQNLHDTPQSNDRFALAGRLNALFPGTGPFWFNGTRTDIADLPRKDTRSGHGMAERRAADLAATGAFTCWQMGGAGAVGGQAMTGMAALSRLCAGLGNHVAVWPFQPLHAPVTLTEIWPSLIADTVRDRQHPGEIRDAAQVRVLAECLWQAQRAEALAPMLNDVPQAACDGEGWILGVGHETALAGPTLANDCFALPPGATWTPVDDALALLRQRLRPVVGRETLPVAQADGRVLACDHTARRSNPPGANSAVDGYGFAHATLPPGTQRLPLTKGRSAAGAPFDGAVPPGHALRILTGALIPEGVDSVVLQEDCTVADGHLRFPALPKPGANTRKAGEDVAKGAPALPARHRLRPPDLALLSAVGIARVEVFAPLRVGVLSTGDELVEPGATDAAARTYDANRPMLLALAARWGHAAVDLGHVGDDRAALRARLDAARETADVVLTSGGASAGEEDHVSALLTEAGAMQAWRIALKPGRPLALGMWGGMPVIGLPGNPVAALVCTLIFARPALSRLAGGAWTPPVAFNVPAAFTKSKKAGRREYLRARIRDGRVEPFASEGSGRISGLSWAEGLIELSEPAQEIAPGDPVRFLPYGGFGF